MATDAPQGDPNATHATETVAWELVSATLRRVAVLRALIDFELDGSSYNEKTVKRIVENGSWHKGMAEEFQSIIDSGLEVAR